jgi:hypothetical protein
MYITRFNIKLEQLTLIKEYLSIQEIYAAREENNAQKEKDEFNLISDSEDNLQHTRS